MDASALQCTPWLCNPCLRPAAVAQSRMKCAAVPAAALATSANNRAQASAACIADDPMAARTVQNVWDRCRAQENGRMGQETGCFGPWGGRNSDAYVGHDAPVGGRCRVMAVLRSLFLGMCENIASSGALQHKT